MIPGDDFDPITELNSLLRTTQQVKETFGPPAVQAPHDLLEVCWEILRCEFGQLREVQQRRRQPRQEGS